MTSPQEALPHNDDYNSSHKSASNEIQNIF